MLSLYIDVPDSAIEKTDVVRELCRIECMVLLKMIDLKGKAEVRREQISKATDLAEVETSSIVSLNTVTFSASGHSSSSSLSSPDRTRKVSVCYVAKGHPSNNSMNSFLRWQMLKQVINDNKIEHFEGILRALFIRN